MSVLASCLMVLGLVPVLWSVALWGLQLLRGGLSDDAVEKRQLALMLAPVALGAACLGATQILPPAVAHAIEQGLTFTAIERTVESSGALPASGVHGLHFGLTLLWAVVAVYGVVVVFKGWRLLAVFYRLQRIVATSETFGNWGPGVHRTRAPAPAFAWRSATVVLPQSLLAVLSDDQVAMVVAHERAHLGRKDTVYYVLLSWVDVVFWFNPFVRYQTERCRLAAELACDQAVTGAMPAQRQVYASSLLAALKHADGAALACAPTIFSPSNSGEFTMRISEIMRTSPGPGKMRRYGLVAVLLVLPVAGVQLAWSQAAANPEALFQFLWDEPAFAAADSQSEAGRELHDTARSEPRDAVWAPVMEAKLSDAYGAGMRMDGRTPYIRVTCETVICEAAIIVEVAPGASDTEINGIIGQFYDVNGKLQGLFNPNEVGIVATDSTPGQHPKHVAMFAFHTRKA